MVISLRFIYCNSPLIIFILACMSIRAVLSPPRASYMPGLNVEIFYFIRGSTCCTVGFLFNYRYSYATNWHGCVFIFFSLWIDACIYPGRGIL